MKFKKIKKEVNDDLIIPDVKKKVMEYASKKQYPSFDKQKTYSNYRYVIQFAVIILFVFIVFIGIGFSKSDLNISKKYDVDMTCEINTASDKKKVKDLLSTNRYYTTGKTYIPVLNLEFGCGSKDMNGGSDLVDEGLILEEEISSTITQVSSIDEGDVVKTDGKYIYCLFQKMFYIYLVEDEVTCILNENLQLDDEYLFISNVNSNGNIYLYGDKVILLFEGQTNQNNVIDSNITICKVYDKEKDFELVYSFVTSGSIIDSRLYNGYLYFITKNLNKELSTFYEDGEIKNKFDYDDVKYIKSSDNECINYIVSFNINNLLVDVKVQLGTSNYDVIYMSPNSLYLASSRYISNQANVYTTIYKYDLNNGVLELSSACMFTGKVNNQWSMDEYNGYLRVVATESYFDNPLMINKVMVFEEEESEDKKTLELKGILNEGIGKPYQKVKSVYFNKNEVSIVTYETMDPLYLISFKTPTTMEIVDSYESSGYSSYLLPIKISDEDYLIGIGYMDESYGIKLSLYKYIDDKITQVGKDLELGYYEYSFFYVEGLSNHRAIFLNTNNDGSFIGFTLKNNIKKYMLIEINPNSNNVFEIKLYEQNTNYERMVYINGGYYLINQVGITKYVYDKNYNSFILDSNYE